jgi:hypothetical protein
VSSLIPWLVASALIAIGAVGLTVLVRPRSALDAGVVGGIMAAAQITGIGLIAGIAGRFERGTVVALAALVAVGAALAARGSVGDLPRPARPSLRRHPWAAAIVALAAIALAWRLAIAVILPPYAFDALTYHLTIVASWIQAGDIAPTSLSLCCARYPGNADLLLAWPALLLGSDALVNTVQLWFAVLGGLATAGLARTAGAPRAGAAAAGGLFVLTPVVLAQASTGYADVLIGATALGGLHLLVRFHVTGQARLLVPAGLAIGLVLGTKGTGVVWGVVLLGLGAVLLGRASLMGRLPPRRAAAAGAALVSGAVALGGFWYARNWIDTGNPLYPFAVDVAGVEIFAGPLRVGEVLTVPDAGAGQPWPVAAVRSWAADLTFWRHGAYDYQQRSGGLGPLWPWLGLPLLLPVTALLARRRQPVLIAFVAIAVVLLIQPYRWWSRFTLGLAAAGALAVVLAGMWAPRRWMRDGIRAGALVLAACGAVLASYEIDPAGRAQPLPAADVIRLAGEPAQARTVGRLFFPEYRFLEEVEDDATIVVDLRAEAVRFVSPLFGPRWRRRVLPGRW